MGYAKENKLKRLDAANQLIEIIASTGRCFFSGNRDSLEPSKIVIGENGWLYYVEAANGKWCAIREPWIKSRYFRHGGTLNHFIRCLAYYIRTGNKLDWNIFSDRWGYGKELDKVIGKSLDLGICRI